MILTKTPLRISLFGGGTDYPAFCDREGGMVLGGTIDKYIYITASILSDFAEENIRLSYRDTESVTSINHIKHPIVREYLKKVNFDRKYAFYTVSDIPGSSGLGSSSSFSVGFIKLVQKIMQSETNAEWLAQEAIDLERNILKEPVGLQDQYHAAFGGFSLYKFKQNKTVSVESFPNLKELNRLFKERSILMFTGQLRSASSILSEQVKNTSSMSKDKYLIKMKELCSEAAQIFRNGISEHDLQDIGHLLKESWSYKMQLANTISNSTIKGILNDFETLGAYGSKVLGAGGGGFVLGIGNEDFRTRVLERYDNKMVIDFEFVTNGCELRKVGN